MPLCITPIYNWLHQRKICHMITDFCAERSNHRFSTYITAKTSQKRSKIYINHKVNMWKAFIISRTEGNRAPAGTSGTYRFINATKGEET